MVKSFFDYLGRFFRNWAETNKELGFFAIETYKSKFFKTFSLKNPSNFTSYLNDNFYEDSFDVHIDHFSRSKTDNFRISPKVFSFWPWSLQKPLVAKLWTSVTSLRSQILAEDVSFYVRHCLLIWNKDWSIHRLLSLTRHFCTPSASLTEQKARIN